MCRRHVEGHGPHLPNARVLDTRRCRRQRVRAPTRFAAARAVARSPIRSWTPPAQRSARFERGQRCGTTAVAHRQLVENERQLARRLTADRATSPAGWTVEVGWLVSVVCTDQGSSKASANAWTCSRAPRAYPPRPDVQGLLRVLHHGLHQASVARQSHFVARRRCRRRALRVPVSDCRCRFADTIQGLHGDIRPIGVDFHATLLAVCCRLNLESPIHTGRIGIGSEIFNDLVAGRPCLRTVQPPCDHGDGIHGTPFVEHFEM